MAIGFYGIFAYSTRHSTPLVMADLDVWLSWRWMYWVYVPIALVGDGAGLAVLPSRPPAAADDLPIDWLAITLFVAWVVAVVFAFSLVPQVGRLDLERLRRDGRPLRRPAAWSWWSGSGRASAPTST